MNTFLLLALFALAGFILQTTILWLAARICGLDRNNWCSAALIIVIKVFAESTLVGVLAAINTIDEWLVAGFVFIVDAVLTVWLLRRLFGGTRRQSTATWAVNLLAGSVAGIVFVIVFTRCLEGFVWSNSSMTPNIRGYHVVEVLPDGAHLIHAANFPDAHRGIPAGEPSGAIVAETYEYREVPRPAVHTHGADRFLCNKTKFPERWDATVVIFANEPDFKSVKRLVGLPGERVAIREGAVWVNGERLKPPPRLGPIRYEAYQVWPAEDPRTFEVTLGPDEYFVLGDNTNRSLDSRMRGPVKRDQIIGVADLIYWPPARWRIRP